MSLSAAIAFAGITISVITMVRYAKGPGLISPIFLFATVNTFYVFPKVISLTLSDNSIGTDFQNTGTDFSVATSSVSCFLAFILFYRLAAKPSMALTEFIIDQRVERILFRYGLAVGVLGLVGSVLLVFRNGGISGYYFGAGFYRMDLVGINVWLIFLSRFVYPGIVAILLISVNRPNLKYFISLAILAVFPLLNVVILFRRSDLLFMAFIIVYVLVFVLKLRMRRATTLVLVFLSFVSIIAFPYMRQELISSATGWEYGSNNLSSFEQIEDSFKIEINDEIVRAASTIQLVKQTGNLKYGTFVWNSLIHQFIPGSIVGSEFKQSLKISFSVSSGSHTEYVDSTKYFYLAPMGFADAYSQFGPFGFIIFAAFGVFIARVERNSYRLSNRIFLILAIPIVCLAATNDIGSTPARLATFWLLTRPLKHGARIQRAPEIPMSKFVDRPI